MNWANPPNPTQPGLPVRFQITAGMATNWKNRPTPETNPPIQNSRKSR